MRILEILNSKKGVLYVKRPFRYKLVVLLLVVNKRRNPFSDASIPLRKGILSTPESHSKVAPKKYSTVSTPSATISGGSRDRKISCRSLKNDVCKSESPVVRFAPDRPTSATEKSLVDSPESDSPGDNQGFDSTEDDTISTSSSYVSGSPDDLKPERQVWTMTHNRTFIVTKVEFLSITFMVRFFVTFFRDYCSEAEDLYI